MITDEIVIAHRTYKCDMCGVEQVVHGKSQDDLKKLPDGWINCQDDPPNCTHFCGPKCRILASKLYEEAWEVGMSAAQDYFDSHKDSILKENGIGLQKGTDRQVQV